MRTLVSSFKRIGSWISNHSRTIGIVSYILFCAGVPLGIVLLACFQIHSELSSRSPASLAGSTKAQGSVIDGFNAATTEEAPDTPP